MAEGFFFILEILEYNHRWHHQASLICILDSFWAKNQSTTTITEGFFFILSLSLSFLNLQRLDALVSQSTLLFIFSFFFSLLRSICQWFIYSNKIFCTDLRLQPALSPTRGGLPFKLYSKAKLYPQPTLQFILQFATSPTRGTPGVIFLTFVISY